MIKPFFNNMVRSSAPEYTTISKVVYDPNDERFGGAFLVPFLAGAVVSAPFWYLGATNKANQMYNQQMYYQNTPYNYNPYQQYYYPLPPK